MLNVASMASEFHVEAVDMACYLVNRSPLIAPIDKNPYEAWAHKKPSIAHLRVFGCEAFIHVLKEKRSKLDDNSEKYIFIKYKDGGKGYKLCNMITRKGYILREVIGISKDEVLRCNLLCRISRSNSTGSKIYRWSNLSKVDRKIVGIKVCQGSTDGFIG